MHDAHHGMWRTLTLWTTCVVVLPLSAVGAVDFPSARGTIKLHYEHALLSAEIEHATLAEVLAALRQLPGVQVRTLGALPADGAVSVTVHGVPLTEGIRKILRDTSYVLQVHEVEVTVHVLPGHGNTEVSPPIVWQEPPNTTEEPDDLNRDGTPTQSAQARTEARLTQAITALHSTRAHGHAEALDQLAYSSDARAIEAVTQVAMGTLHVAPAIRVHAVVALARHALQGGSSDPSLVPVLEQLAGDGDDAVRAVARQSLEDLKQQHE